MIEVNTCRYEYKSHLSGPAVSDWLQRGAYSMPTPFSVMTHCLLDGAILVAFHLPPRC